jgi:hypothetical protein
MSTGFIPGKFGLKTNFRAQLRRPPVVPKAVSSSTSPVANNITLGGSVGQVTLPPPSGSFPIGSKPAPSGSGLTGPGKQPSSKVLFVVGGIVAVVAIVAIAR